MMTSSSEQFVFEEEEGDSDMPLGSNGSSIFMHSSSSSSDPVSKEYVQELKDELNQRCQLEWLNKFEAWKHSPKVELNLLLHGAIREATLKRLARAKGIPFENNDQTIANLFRVRSCEQSQTYRAT